MHLMRVQFKGITGFMILKITVLAMVIASMLLIGGCEKVKKGDYIGQIRFSYDGKKLLFDRKKDDQPYRIHVYDLETEELSAYQPPPNERWSMAAQSFDGGKIAFIITPIAGGYLSLEDSQIAVMEVGGTNIRKITRSRRYKIFPSFSHSGEKIILGSAGKIREKGHTVAADYDVYEVDIKTETEKQLTNFRFYMMSAPYYFPDDKAFIFSAESPSHYDGTDKIDEISKIRKKLKFMYNENKIYLMKGGEKVLKPHFQFYKSSDNPLLDKDGTTLLFMSWGDPAPKYGTGHQYYVYSADGIHRKVTDVDATSVWYSAISPDGKWIAIVYDVAPKRELRKIVIYGVDCGTKRDIVLPDQPTRIINQ